MALLFLLETPLFIKAHSDQVRKIQKSTLNKKVYNLAPDFENSTSLGTSDANRRAFQISQLQFLFIPNTGQYPDKVKFFAHCGNSTFFFSNDGIYTTIPNSSSKSKPKHKDLDRKITVENIHLYFVDANSSPKIKGDQELTSRVNYFIGKDISKWKRNVRTFASIVYEDLYPGINVRFYGVGGDLEYDIVVQPDVSPEKVLLAYKGIQEIKKEKNGDLLVRLKYGNFKHKRPHIYQLVNGKKRIVKGEFRIFDSQSFLKHRIHKFAFELGEFDKEFPITIDPILSFSTYFGGSGFDQATGVAVDSDGGIYVTGATTSFADFPVTLGAFDVLCEPNGTCGKNSDSEAYVAKFTNDGSKLIFCTYLGGNKGGDGGGPIMIDATGSIYVAGSTYSVDFPTLNAYQSTFGGGSLDGFLTKLDSNGSQIIFSTYLGRSGSDSIQDLVLSENNDVVVFGGTNSPDFPTTSGAYDQACGTDGNCDPPSNDLFVTRISSDGESLVFSTFLGGRLFDITEGGLTIAQNGDIVLAGYTFSPDFPTTVGAYDTMCGTDGQCNGSGNHDAFAATLSSDGATLLWSTFLGGSDDDAVSGIGEDNSGNIVVAGSTCSNDFPTLNAYQDTNQGICDVFLTSLLPDGSGLVFSTYLGGQQFDASGDVAAGENGNVYVTGGAGTGFPTLHALKACAGSDAFLAEFTSAGSLVYSTCFGGSGSDSSGALTLDSTGAVLVVGDTDSSDFPIKNAIQNTKAIQQDGFVTKIICNAIDDVQAKEGNLPGGTAIFTISLCSPNPADAMVDFATADGTAIAGEDYVASSGTIFIPADSIEASLSIPLIADVTFEGPETFFVNLSNTVGVTVNDSQGQGTILEDDAFFYDDFENGFIVWQRNKGLWLEGQGVLYGSAEKKGILTAPVPWPTSDQSSCSTCTFQFDVETSGGEASKVFLDSWYEDRDNRVSLILKPEIGKWVLKHISNGSTIAKGSFMLPILPGTTYSAEISFDGSSFHVVIDGVPRLTVPTSLIPNGNVSIKIKKTTASFQQIKVF